MHVNAIRYLEHGSLGKTGIATNPKSGWPMPIRAVQLEHLTEMKVCDEMAILSLSSPGYSIGCFLLTA